MSRFSGFLSVLAILTLALFTAGVLAPLAPSAAQTLGLAPPKSTVLILSVFGLWLIGVLFSLFWGAPRLARLIEPLDGENDPRAAVAAVPETANETEAAIGSEHAHAVTFGSPALDPDPQT